jgi:hypothetical protein
LQNLRNGQTYFGKNFETLRISEMNGDSELDSRMLFDVATTGATQSGGQR